MLKAKIATFRIKELQQCLDLLGLRKAGRKAELSQRLVAFVEQGSPAEVEKKGEQALPGVQFVLELCGAHDWKRSLLHGPSHALWSYVGTGSTLLAHDVLQWGPCFCTGGLK